MPQVRLSAALGVDVVLAGDVAAAARRAGLAPPVPFKPPHPHLSLTHAGDVVVAAAVAPADRARVRGLGIDYEPADRNVTARAGRLYLDDYEVSEVDARPEQERSAARLALWTVKEAAYKATPDNGNHTVASYHVRDGVTRFRDELTFRHTTLPFARGHLAVAVLLDDELEAIRQRFVALLPQVPWEVGDVAG